MKRFLILASIMALSLTISTGVDAFPPEGSKFCKEYTAENLSFVIAPLQVCAQEYQLVSIVASHSVDLVKVSTISNLASCASMKIPEGKVSVFKTFFKHVNHYRCSIYTYTYTYKEKMRLYIADVTSTDPGITLFAKRPGWQA